MSKERIFEPYQKAERSIIKKYRKQLWSPFIYAIKHYDLIQEGDRIAVCISGGKDSMLMAKLMQELQRHSDFPFELEFLVMDPGYNEINRQKIESNARLLHIPITIFETNVFEVANGSEKNPCYLCARMRRGHLYSKAKALGCNKIALGHHFDDAVETFMMNLFNEGRIACFSPVTYLDRKKITMIRPLVYAPEKDIRYFINHSDLPVLGSPCPMDKTSDRERYKKMLAAMDRENKGLKHRILGAMQKADIDGWQPKEK